MQPAHEKFAQFCPMTVTLPCLALKFLFGDTHTNIITHGYHIVKLIFCVTEKQNKVMVMILMMTLILSA